MTIGQRIRKKRKEDGLTLRLLSEKCNISISFLCDIEQDRRRPSLARLADIAKELNISVAYLLGEEEADTTVKPLYAYEHKSTLFREVLEKIEDFDNWKQEDKQELLTYLTVKRKVRSAKTDKP